MKTETITITIEVPHQEVYSYVRNAENLPHWASGFALSVRPHGEGWIVTTTGEEMQFQFAPVNQFGVLDHQVTTDAGEVFDNPMRVIPNGNGSEVLFTLFQTPSTSDAQFEQDTGVIRSDLNALKQVLEAHYAPQR